jgi:GNAT superfamily N-acetyltransferase
MFASVDLAARIEHAEAGLSADIGTAVLSRGAMPEAFVEEIGGGYAVYAGPDSPINKVIGVGFSGPPDEERLAQIEALFAVRGSNVQVEISTLADPSWHSALSPRGYTLVGFENVLGLDLRELASPLFRLPAAVTVMECGPAEEAAWLDTVAAGFACPDDVPAQASGQEYTREAIERVFEDLASARGFRRYLARVDGQLAGGASLRFCEGIAQLCGAATLPAFRRRGVQSALLTARLRDAVQLGCDLAVITTAPGSKSMQNAQKRGFALLYSRALHIMPMPER